MKKRFWAFALMVVMLISIFPVSVLAQENHKLTVKDLDGGTLKLYETYEDGELLRLYCFNSDLTWPSTADPTLAKDYVHDTLFYLNDETKEKIYRIFYAGYPHNSIGICTYKNEPATAQEVKDAVIPPDKLKQLLTEKKGYTWNFDISIDELLKPSSAARDRFFAMFTDRIFDDSDYLEAMVDNPNFITVLMNWGALINYDKPEQFEDFKSTYEFFKLKETDAVFHDATQYAIWHILNKSGVPNNSKPYTWALALYPLAQKLVDFANKVGDHADDYIPPRDITIDAMKAYQEEFIKGTKLLRADGTPVGAGGTIVFTHDGTEYVSEPLHFDKNIYTLPYHITLNNGDTILGDPVINYGNSDEFRLKSSSIPSNAKVVVNPHDEFPSEVYEFAREDQRALPLSERSIQDMGGVYYRSIDMAVNFTTEFREKQDYGSLKVYKKVNGYPAEASGKEFKFTVKLSDDKINGLYGSMNFENGVATFTLEGGHFREADNLPAGITYTVTEEDYSGAGFTTEKIGDTGTITKDQTATASFTNTYKAKSVDVTLKGNKTMNGKNLSEGEFSFTITGDKAGGTVTVNNKADGSINFGTYKFEAAGIDTFVVKEVNDGRDGINYDNTVYNITVTVTDDGSGELKATITGCAPTGDNINFTNGVGGGDDHDGGGGSGETSITRNGSLTISKNVTGDLGDKNKLFTFHVAFNTDNYYAYTGSKTGVIKNGGTVQLKDGESITINGIPSGVAYAIVESDNAGYRVYKTGDAGIIVADQTLKASFTNTKSSVPQTGDNRHLFIWMGIMAISFIGCIISLVFTIRKRESHE